MKPKLKNANYLLAENLDKILYFLVISYTQKYTLVPKYKLGEKLITSKIIIIYIL